MPQNPFRPRSEEVDMRISQGLKDLHLTISLRAHKVTLPGRVLRSTSDGDEEDIYNSDDLEDMVYRRGAGARAQL